MAHSLGALLNAMQVLPERTSHGCELGSHPVSSCLHQFGLVTRLLTTDRIGVDILVEKLIWITLWAVRWQVEQLQLLSMLSYHSRTRRARCTE